MFDRSRLPVHATRLLGLMHAEAAEWHLPSLASLSTGDWEDLVRAAIDYRLAFRLRQALSLGEVGKARIPEAVWERLDEVVHQTRQMNIRRILQLRHFAAACAAEGIPFLLMKGLWLVEVAYRDTAARGSGDIDVLVRPGDMPRFTALMSRLGFDVPEGVQDLREVAPSSHEYALPHRKLGTSLDIHWAMTHPGKEVPVDEDSFWLRSETYPISGHPIQSLGLEDHLLLLCFHAVVHHRFMYVGPRALLDVAQVIAQPPRAIDWEDFIGRAQGLGWDRAAWLMLELVRRHVGIQPPIPVMDALRPGDTPPLDVLSAAVEALFLDQPEADRFDPVTVAVLSNGNPWLFVPSVLRRLIATPERVATHFGVKAESGMAPWLIIKRWCFLFRRNFPMFLQWLRSDPARQAELRRSKILLTWLEAERDYCQVQKATSSRKPV